MPSDSPAAQIVLRYKTAMKMAQAAESDSKSAAGFSNEACETFRSLADDKSLNESVRWLARVRANRYCPADRAPAMVGAPKWLAEEVARSSLVSAKRTANVSAIDRRALATALRDVAPFEKTQRDTIARLREALDAVKDQVDLADLAKEVRARLVSAAPRFALEAATALPEAESPDKMVIANDLRRARKFDDARRFYSEVADDSKRAVADRLKALDGIRMSYKLELKVNEAIAASDRMLEMARENLYLPGIKGKDNSLLRQYLDVALQNARAVWTDHRPSDATKLLLKIEKLLSAKSGAARPLIPLHESILLRARIAEEDGRFQEMADILETIAIEPIPEAATRAKLFWYKGWNLRRLGRLSEAVAALERGEGLEDSHTALTRNQFWIARIYRELGETTKAEEKLNALADFSPFGYYGLLAFNELKRPLPPLAQSELQAYDPRSSNTLPENVRVPIDWFVALEEPNIGKRFLDSFPSNTLWDLKGSQRKKEDYLAMLSRLGQHQLLTAKLDELPATERAKILNERPDLMFPTPFKNLIFTGAERQGLDPSLIYSIIRQESLFNPMARSAADAFGLMQLIPEMAAQAAKTAGHGKVAITHEDLYDPEINVPLGAAFLRQLLDRYRGRFILAVAAYNANDKAIQGWLRTRLRKDPLEFIEEIPYDETRLYVRLVLRNFATYQRRFATSPVPFPAWTLNLIASP